MCKILWFYKGSERIGPAKELWSRPELAKLTQLELERLEWIGRYEDNHHATKYWNEWIKEKSEKLYNEYKEYMNDKESGASSKRIGNIDLSHIKS